jgi:hypothetical protein
MNTEQGLSEFGGPDVVSTMISPLSLWVWSSNTMESNRPCAT